MSQLPYARIGMALRHSFEQWRTYSERDRARIPLDDPQCEQRRQHRLLRQPRVGRALARERRLLRLRMVRRTERARGPASTERQPVAARARAVRALSRRLQYRVPGLAP